MHSIELSDPIIEALARLVDDGQSDIKREPTHSTLTFYIGQAKLLAGDPAHSGQTVGKAKRVRAVLSWSMGHAPDQGARFAATLISIINGSGGFRPSSPNYVGDAALADAVDTLAVEGYILERDGSLRPLLLDALSDRELSTALAAYVRRAKRGAMDAALVTGTGKDLLEATAKHVLVVKLGSEPKVTNLPTLLAQAFMVLNFCIAKDTATTPQQRLEAALFELGCSVNSLRNTQGTGHGRPFLPTVSEHEARAAIESMGILAERMLAEL
jgi:hypothetical protein